MPDRPPRLLIADDQADVLEALKLLLKGEGFDVETAASPRAVLSALEARDFDALLVDMNYTRAVDTGPCRHDDQGWWPSTAHHPWSS